MALEVHQNRIGSGRNIPLQVGGGFSSTLGGVRRKTPITLDLLHHSEPNSSLIDLDEHSPLPVGWHKCLDLKTGQIYYREEGSAAAETMSRNGRNPKLELKLNLSPPRVNRQTLESPNRSVSSMSPISPPSSCVSSELNMEAETDPGQALRYSNSPEATSMVLVGCPRCLMYVMLSEEEPKCPKCKSTVLLDFLHENNDANVTKKKRI